MSKEYLKPEIEIIRLAVEDIITTSSGLDEDELPPIPVNPN